MAILEVGVDYVLVTEVAPSGLSLVKEFALQQGPA